ncbi:MAG: cyclic nucleotide-binding domain-containing protein [Ignavibacteria bacterium]|nr:cyclic nucleotide-binding domain-containing protein [Ignavibacteria bacterium]
MKKSPDQTVHSSFWSNLFKKNVSDDDLAEILRDMPPFQFVSNNVLQQILASMHARQYIAGEFIFYQDDPGIGLYIINEGQVDIEYISPTGKSVQLAEFKEGDFFGELALLDGDTRSASARAKSDCKVSVLFKPDLDSIIERYPKEGAAILGGIAKIVVTRLRQLNSDYFQLYNLYSQIKEAHHGN